MGINRLISLLFFGLLAFSMSLNAQGDVQRGADLHQGKVAFTNGGVACITCHNVDNALVVSGGELAKDLTKLFSDYGGADAMAGETIKGMLASAANMPSPVMVRTYTGKELTAEEAADLAAFFEEAATNSSASQQSAGFVVSGIVGFVILFILILLFGKGRKAKTVNAELYDRQLKTR